MMISPEAYYEICLKGKSKEDILKEIKSLKREINKLRKKIESPDPEQKEIIYPTSLTRLKCNRQYLDRAIAAYEEAGGEYVFTQAEQKVRNLDRDLGKMSRLVFSIGSFFSGHETRTYTISGDQVMLNIEHTLLLKPSNLPSYCPFTKEDFIDGLRNIHLGEWKKNYDDPCVCDGTQWELEIQFNGKRKPFQVSGSNAYPYNFDDLTEFLGIDQEEDDDPDQD